MLFLGAAPVPASRDSDREPKAALAPAKPQDGGRDGLSTYERADIAASGRANDIAEAQRRYGLIQLALGSLGVSFTGIAAFFAWRATHWAKEAAGHTKRSADADNAALAETRAASAEARREATEQAERFERQISATSKSAEAAASAYLSEHRPKIVLRDVFVLGRVGDNAEIVYSLVNVGGNDATIVESWVFTEIMGHREPARNPRSYGHDDLGRLVLSAGQFVDLTHIATGGAPSILLLPHFLGADDQSRVHFAGALVYEDGAGRRRRSVFRRVYNTATKRFDRSPDADDEYSD